MTLEGRRTAATPPLAPYCALLTVPPAPARVQPTPGDQLTAGRCSISLRVPRLETPRGAVVRHDNPLGVEAATAGRATAET